MSGGPPPSAGPAGVYVHVPFCERQCTFCDFPTVIGRSERIEPYLDALVAEIAFGQPTLPREVDTVYVGGGTPSRLDVAQMRRLLDAVRDRFLVSSDAEITVECNPESLDDTRLTGYAEAGVTRISLGIQTLADDVLRATGRLHDRAASLGALRAARRAGAFAVSVDLIAGLPDDPADRWMRTLETVLAEGPDHVSVYLLEFDKPTPLGRAIRAGRVRLPDDRALATLYGRAAARLAAGGWEPYEIASYARPGFRCHHNRKYWTECWYGGFGLGAHAYAAGERRANLGTLEPYLAAVAGGMDPAAWIERWNPRDRLIEALIAGLRVVEGIDLERLGVRYPHCGDLRRRLAPAIAKAADEGWIEARGASIALTPAGRPRSDRALMLLLEALPPADPAR